MMDALPNIFPKSIIEVLNRLENDEDNRYSWKLTRNQDSLSLKGTYKSSKSGKIWKKMVLRAKHIIFCGKKIRISSLIRPLIN